MPKSRNQITKNIIITTSGMDGACSAAALILDNPEREIITSSITRLGNSLRDIAITKPDPSIIHICGTGIDSIEEILNISEELKNLGHKIIWHCGRNYLNKFQKVLQDICELNFRDCSSNTEAILKYLKKENGAKEKLLRELAREFIANNPEKIAAKNLFWHKFINNAASKFFRFGDQSAYPKAIRKLAGIEGLADKDKQEVEQLSISDNKKLPTGQSRQMKALRRNISHIAPHDEPVLILGPSGAGKELAARSVHEGSPRAAQPFIAINCATFAKDSDMAHDRLFGHIKGAFTGATGNSEGAFQIADRGTLFLDEVAELPLDTQTSLLRVLEEGIISPLGSMEKKKIDVRIIAATNQDIPQMIRNGKFRLDLFYRLNVLCLNIPPLKERKEDLRSIVANVSHTLRQDGYKLEISEEGWTAIYNYDWPGNIRQFINTLKRSVYMDIPIEDIVEQEKSLNLHDIEVRTAPETSITSHLNISYPSISEEILPEEVFRKKYMQKAYELMGRNLSETAKTLKITRNTLKKWLE